MEEGGLLWNIRGARRYFAARGDALMRSQASLKRTVGEFLENNSDVRAYMSTAEIPAPRRITARFEVRCVVRITFPPVLSSDHCLTFFPLREP
jgi:hypothetical protein